MTKTVWILGAVVVVGIAIAAGLIFTRGNQPIAIAAEATKGAGIESETVTTVVPQTVTSESVHASAVETDLGSEPGVVEPVASSEESVGPIIVASIDELIASAASYSNREVIVRGTIVTQCISGCTFSLEDGTGVVPVELVDDALDNVLAKGSVGRQVEVRGVIEGSPRPVIMIEQPDGWRYLD